MFRYSYCCTLSVTALRRCHFFKGMPATGGHDHLESLRYSHRERQGGRRERRPHERTAGGGLPHQRARWFAMTGYWGAVSLNRGSNHSLRSLRMTDVGR